ncbi:MAG TPA: tetratricopeptide repeat protein [Planctomycetota bacterium]|jgi:tetratricopeptide (TPR) repeat protein
MKRFFLAGPLFLLAACASRPIEEVNAEQSALLREEGDAALKEGDCDRAIDIYTRALELNPGAADTWYRRGNAFTKHPPSPDEPNRKREWLRLAEADYSAAVRLNPAHRDALFNRAMIRLKMKRYIDAAKDLVECTRIDPRDPEPEFILGHIYLHRLEDQQIMAMEHYDKYVALGGTDPEAVKLVREWRELKKSMVGSNGGTAPKGPTAEDEEAAKQLHAKVLTLIPKGEEQRPEIARLLVELTTKYAQTKYVKDNEKGLKALLNAFRPRDPEKK